MEMKDQLLEITKALTIIIKQSPEADISVTQARICGILSPISNVHP